VHDAFHVGFVLTAGFESRCLVDLDLLLGGISQSAVFSPSLMIIRASITKELIGKTAQASTEGLAQESIRPGKDRKARVGTIAELAKQA